MLARLIFFIFLAQTAGAQAPWMGEWRLDPSQSNSPGNSRYKRVDITIEPWQDGLRVRYDMIGVRGGVTHTEWTGRFDGKDYVMEGVDAFITNAYTLMGDRGYRILVKSDGAPVATTTVTISPDGRTLTAVTDTTGPQGGTIRTTSVYQKMRR